MLTKKTIGAALACALALGAWSGTTLATPVNVGGVMVDPASKLDLNIQALNFRESSVSQVGDTLTGYGLIGSVNGQPNGSSPVPGSFNFCPGCELTFTFQYTVAAIDTTGSNPKVVFDAGVINFFRDDTQSFNVLNPDSAGIGTLWLSLGGHPAAYAGFTTVGDLYSTITGPVSTPTSGSTGFGLLDVTGGLAAYFADTNAQTDGADFELDSSFQFQDAGICGADETCYPISGTGQLIGKSVSVPEPGAAGLLGLGLGFLGLFAWRRNKEAEGRA